MGRTVPDRVARGHRADPAGAAGPIDPTIIITATPPTQYPDTFITEGITATVADDRDNYPPSDWFEAEDWPWPVMADDTDLTAFGVFVLGIFPGLAANVGEFSSEVISALGL